MSRPCYAPARLQPGTSPRRVWPGSGAWDAISALWWRLMRGLSWPPPSRQIPWPETDGRSVPSTAFYRQGRISGCGSRIRADFVPTYTATVLERLDCAGALDIARLNMSEFALGATGHNDITGTPRNPWNQNHVPGGSSSGPAVAVAAGLVYASLGSDTGGSIRQPSAFCGVVGLKPTYGRVSRHGVMPLSFTLDHVGPIARSARDCAVILQAIAGHDAADLTSSTEP
jgi:aspartyl-tRNA(Asn)/glutamyl-tRNA(Gln) amidotransferase subunit A